MKSKIIRFKSLIVILLGIILSFIVVLSSDWIGNSDINTLFTVIVLVNIIYDVGIKYPLLSDEYNISLLTFLSKYNIYSGKKQKLKSYLIVLCYVALFVALYVVIDIFTSINSRLNLYNYLVCLLVPVFVVHFKSFIVILGNKYIIVSLSKIVVVDTALREVNVAQKLFKKIEVTNGTLQQVKVPFHLL